ncbi:MAG TPA: arginine deiminase-related protein [Flavobacteriaceae bacterium]|nr:arginine deiminase-related protein [Flavobacteriaceae bacterium]
MKQITNTILMVRPVQFRMNEQTAVNNYFQEDIEDVSDKKLQNIARDEFDDMTNKLIAAGVNVVIVEDIEKLDTPDSIFPNNWVSFHENGDVAIYPMFAENRRLERRGDIFDLLEQKGFIIKNIVDYTSAEENNLFLEGTGSLILDRVNRKAYCALSARADEELLIEFCEDFEYMPIPFVAYQSVEDERLPIYHTNVMMALAEEFAIICLDSIDDKKERKNVIKHLKADGKEIIAITEKQVHCFAGNMLQVMGDNDKPYLVMSTAAFESLNPQQIKTIEKYCEIIHSSLETVETLGGGSARCMMAEVFLPKREE